MSEVFPDQEPSPTGEEDFADFVDRVIKHVTIEAGPDRGHIVVDRLIGAILRKKDFVTDEGPRMTGLDVITNLDEAGAKTESQDRDERLGARNHVVEANGLRKVFGRLSVDGRTGSLLGHFGERIKVNPDTGKVTLTTLDQIAGYIEGASEIPDSDTWQDEMLALIEDTLLMSQSDGKNVSEEQISKHQAVFAAAEQAGMDVSVIERSVDALYSEYKKRGITEHDLAALRTITLDHEKLNTLFEK